MYTYVRATKLHDIVGRSAYITNETGKHKEEDVVCCGGAVENWKPYHAYEREHQRSSERNNEGRELIVALPNAWASLIAKPFLKSRVDALARQLIGKSTDYQFAVHWNSTHTNLHAHIIFSERIRSQNASERSQSDFYDRDIYLTKDGKIARRKADRALNEDGTIKPPVHRKGELKNPSSDYSFSAKDKKYKSKAWLQDCKKAVHHAFILDSDKKHVTNYIHTYHEGKEPIAAMQIRETNKIARNLNNYLHELKQQGYKLKNQGDPVYMELYRLYFTPTALKQDNKPISAQQWIMSNIVINQEETELKRQSKAEKEEKARERQLNKELEANTRNAERQERQAQRAAEKKERKQDKQEKTAQQQEQKLVNTAYALAKEVYCMRVNLSIPKNGYYIDAMEELAGDTYTYKELKQLPKKEKELKKLTDKLDQRGKARLIERLEDYFSIKLDKKNSFRTSFYDEPYDEAKKLVTELEPTAHMDIPLSPSETKGMHEQEERSRQRERERLRQLYAKEQQEQERERVYKPKSEPEPEPEYTPEIIHKRNDYSR